MFYYLAGRGMTFVAVKDGLARSRQGGGMARAGTLKMRQNAYICDICRKKRRKCKLFKTLILKTNPSLGSGLTLKMITFADKCLQMLTFPMGFYIMPPLRSFAFAITRRSSGFERLIRHSLVAAPCRQHYDAPPRRMIANTPNPDLETTCLF